MSVLTLRQHIASLIAVFFSMIVGILVGVALTGPPGREQSLLLRRIETRLRRLVDENRRLAERVKELEGEISFRDRIDEQLARLVFEGRLEGRSLAVIWAGRAKGKKALLGALSQARAKVVGEVELRPGMAKLKQEIVSRMAKALQVKEPLQPGILSGKGAHLLAFSIVEGKAPKILTLLRKAGATRHVGTFGAPADTVVIVHPKANLEGTIPPGTEEGLVKGATQSGAYVVACETTKVSEEDSFVPLYQRFDVPTVDNVDTPPGRIALVLVLEGRRGHFGIKSTAEGPLPPLGG